MEIPEELLEEVVDVLLEAEGFIESDPLFGTQFNPAQLRGVCAFTAEGVKIVICPMPNGIGKTFMTVGIMGAIMWPTFNPHFSAPIFRRWPFKKELRFVSTAKAVEDGEAFQTAVRELWPKGRYTLSRGTGKGFYSKIEADTGFNVDVLTYNQAPLEHASGTKGAVFMSEPPPKKIFSENYSRLRMGGILFLEMTPITYAAYIKDDYIDKGGLYLPDPVSKKPVKVGRIEVVTGDLEENCADHTPGGQVPHEQIQATIAGWPVEERELRRTGGFGHLAGRIYQMFSRENGNIIDALPAYHQELFDRGRFNLVQTLDPHDRKPWAIGWHAVFPNDDVVTIAEFPDLVFHETDNSPYDIEDYRAAIFETEQQLSMPADRRIIDPNFGNSPKLASLTVKQLLAGPCRKCSRIEDPAKRAASNERCEHRLTFRDPPDGLAERHLLVRQAIGNAKEGKRAKYMVLAPYCPNHVYALEHYGYKEEKRPEERGPSEQALLVHKDFPDGVGYLYLDGAKFREPSSGPIRYWKPKRGPKGARVA